MKKHLLCTALVAGLACAPNAHADAVTLYGVVDAGLGYDMSKHKHHEAGKAHRESRLRAVESVMAGSRFGMMGSESLGDGVRAVFKLESGFNAVNGRSGQGRRLFGRDAYVGLQSDTMGGLYFGRQSNGSDAYLDAIDPFGTAFGLSGVDTVIGNSTRGDNMVVYKTPNMAGLSALVGYSFNVDDNVRESSFGTGNNNRLTTFGAMYANGPFTMVGTYDYFRAAPTSLSNRRGGLPQWGPGTIKAGSLGASFDLEVVKLAGAVGHTSGGWISGKDLEGTLLEDEESRMGGTRVRPGFKALSTMVGLTVPVGPGTVMTSWQRADPNNDSLTGARHIMNVYALGYRHALSKRTALYAYGAYVDHYAFNDLSNQSVAVGMRHTF